MSIKLLQHRAALCNRVRVIAEGAGALVLPYHEALGDLAVEKKADGSPVTQADRAAEEFITAGLRELAADIPVVGEETAQDLPQDWRAGQYFWLVDPIDGTREFLRGGNDFTINIALIEDGEPVLGVIYAPALEEMYAGFTDSDGTKTAYRVIAETSRDKPMQVRRPPHAGLTIMASTQYPVGGVMDDFLKEFKVEKVIKRASSLKICAIAAGKADLYPRFGRTGEWDTAAGDAILRAAGGVIKAYDTRAPLRYGLRAPHFENPAFVAGVGDLF